MKENPPARQLLKTVTVTHPFLPSFGSYYMILIPLSYMCSQLLWIFGGAVTRALNALKCLLFDRMEREPSQTILHSSCQRVHRSRRIWREQMSLLDLSRVKERHPNLIKLRRVSNLRFRFLTADILYDSIVRPLQMGGGGESTFLPKTSEVVSFLD